ncbi:uncharacterized protein DUF2479 [Ruminiclostridium sufflavum DSM 19573]|uniref:Uncharacterized protein DUF2479 n=1 Tax=Ruminiclostridium sufflavum DSM 19573 TaxID=1121337 RepID=A0A318XQK9_9FIRM|nr:BppU family phage baseplate upper protein [Ruminiclostridium sufflavum]PYG88505.1 uncharacterized protein DUF2479 [Ruminiclostridium sufflavum DSM 19573]
MIVNTYDIVLDISEQNYINSNISLVQNDCKVNKFAIRIFDGSAEIDYTKVITATITFLKADGNVVQGNLISTDIGFTYNLGTNEIAIAGTVFASVQLMGADGERLTTSQFSFIVVSDLINPSAVQSTTEFAILQQLKEELEAIDVVALTNKVGTGTLNTTSQNCVDAINEVNAAINNKVPFKTTNNITYYVRTDGSNANDGSANDSAHAFLTISKAISMIPQIVNHVVTIYVAAGTYNEELIINGFSGSGGIRIIGAGNLADSVNYIVTGKIIIGGHNCANSFLLQGIKTTYSGNGEFSIRLISGSNLFIVQYCRIEPVSYVAGSYGIWAYACNGNILNCNVSNINYAIGVANSNVLSYNNGGSGNGVALIASNAGTLGKVGTQPTATTAEQVSNGGAIRT